VRNAQEGWGFAFYEVDKPETLKAGLLELLGKPEHRAELARRNAQRASSQERSFAPTHLAIFKELTSGKPRDV
jgi:hypothetical protein